MPVHSSDIYFTIKLQANREKKKLVKQAYKSEEIKQTTLMVAQRVNQRVVFKF